MAQMHRQNDSPRIPASPNTVEQLLRGEASTWSPKSSLSSASIIPADQDLENDHAQHHKKSVLMKMKDKAKKLRNSFSKRRHGEDVGNASPSWRATLDKDEEQDAEYHGAPMCESDLAPNEYHQDSARNHHNPKLLSNIKVLARIRCKSTPNPREKPQSPNKDKAIGVAANVIYNPSGPNKALSPGKRVASIKPPSPRQLISQTNMIDTFPSPRKATSQTAGTSSLRKATTLSAGTSPPRKATTQSASTSSPSKETTQFSSSSSPSKATTVEDSYKGDSPSKASTSGTVKKASDMQALAYPTTSYATHAITSNTEGVTISKTTSKETSSASAPITPQKSSAFVTLDSQPLSAPARTAKEVGHSKDHLWEKGVSVKEYIMRKLEPGEDDRALSRVIYEAMSPRKTTGDAGVVDKLREVVSSLLQSADSSHRSMDTQSANHYSSTQIPVSTNPQEDAVCDQEGNQRTTS